VGGIEAEAVMLGQSISMVLPEVVGYKLTGEPNPLTTSTDIVLTITKVSYYEDATRDLFIASTNIVMILWMIHILD
jgi:aconitase A